MPRRGTIGWSASPAATVLPTPFISSSMSARVPWIRLKEFMTQLCESDRYPKVRCLEAKARQTAKHTNCLSYLRPFRAKLTLRKSTAPGVLPLCCRQTREI